MTWVAVALEVVADEVAGPVLRRRKSTFLHGIEDDAREVVAHLVGNLG